jgi:hypothetical protein
VSVRARLADAELLWRNGRREGALLNVLIAVAASSRDAHPSLGDHKAFVQFLKSTHQWTMSVEFRGQQVDVDEMFYTWLRCELVHTGSLPMDIRIADELDGLSLRAGGAPDYVVLVSPAWFDYFTAVVRAAI